MKEILMYTLEYKMIHLILVLVMGLFYLTVYLEATGKMKPVIKNKGISALVAFALTLLGAVGFLNVMLG